MPKNTNWVIYQMHLATLLYGFTAVLGKLIDMKAIPMVWWRLLLAWITILGVLVIQKKLRRIKCSQMKKLFAIGFLLGVHWWLFYLSIKLSNASITLISISTATFFSVIIEAIILRKPIDYYDFAIGTLIVVIFGFMSNIIPQKYYLGLLVALLSIVVVIIYSVLNKIYAKDVEPIEATLVQFVGAWCLLSVLVVYEIYQSGSLYEMIPRGIDIGYMLFFSVICTAFTHILYLNSINKLGVFTTSLILNLEPIYGIILAIIFLNEQKDLDISFYLVSIILLLIVLVYPYFKRKYWAKNLIEEHLPIG